MAVSKKNRTVLVGNTGYGLYVGETNASDAEVIEKKAVRLVGCRHVAYWKGALGGITSLAAKGPLPGSRIGLRADALITGVVCVYELTPEAITAFDAI